MSADQSVAKPRSGFYFVSACVLAALILLSFPQTYFLPMASGTKSFTLLRHLHGLAFFAFAALFVWQAWLVRRRGIVRHREWGTFGASLAGMMLVLGPWLTIVAIEDRMTQKMPRPYEFALYNLVDIVLFCGLIGWSIREAYRRLDWHRHFAFAAMLGLLGPAWSRWVMQLPYGFPLLDMSPSLFADIGLVALAIHDRRTNGQVHPATVIAAAIMVPLHIATPLVSRSDWWAGLAPRLFGFS
jgi:hypothetical protein